MYLLVGNLSCHLSYILSAASKSVNLGGNFVSVAQALLWW